MTPISIQTARTALLEDLKDISDVPQNTFIRWCQYINSFVYRYLLGVDPERFIKEVPFQVLNNVSVYPITDIMTDFRDFQTENTGLFMTDGNGLNTGVRLSLTVPGNSSSNNSGIWNNTMVTPGYYINQGNFIIVPVPTKNYLLIARYSPEITILNNVNQYFTVDGTDTGFPIIPYEYLEYVLRALEVKYQIWDEEVGAEGFADQRFMRVLNELCENIRRQPQPGPLLDFSQIY